MTDNYNGLQGFFADPLRQLIAASGGRIWINSGYRSVERQQQLWDDAVRKYGEQRAGHYVAAPGHSNHNRGIAADLGGDIALAHQLAPRFGLVFPMGWEPWHIEPINARQHVAQSGGDYTKALTDPTDPTVKKDADPLTSLHAQLTNFTQILQGKTGASLDAAWNLENAPGQTQPGEQTGQGAGGGTAGGGQTFAGQGGGREGWARDFLQGVGAPVNPETIRFMVAWQRAESGGGGGSNNPLNTTQGGFAGESNFNRVGVKNYQTYEDGLRANIQAFISGLDTYRYRNILEGLQRGDAMAAAQGLVNSAWGTGPLVQKILRGG